MIAVSHAGYDRVSNEAPSNAGAAWLLSGFTADEWEFVSREARSALAFAGFGDLAEVEIAQI